MLQSCDFRAGAAEVYFAYHTCTTKLRFSSGSVLHLYYKAAIFELELRKYNSLTTPVLQSCDFQSGAAEVYFTYYTCSTKLRFSSWSCGTVLRVLHYKAAIFELELRKCTSRTTPVLCGTVLRVLHYKAAIFELELRKCTSRTTPVLQSCDFRPGAAEVYFAYYTCSTKLRFSTWSCGSVLRVRHFCYT